MKILRRQFLHLAAGAAALPTVSWAQTRPITVIVPFAAGGPSDVLGRAMPEDKMRSGEKQRKFGQLAPSPA